MDFGQYYVVHTEKIIKLKIWEIADHENKHASIVQGYCRNAAGVLLVYDVTRRASFDKVLHYLEELKEHGPTGLIIMLIGNKSDVLGSSRAVSFEEGRFLAGKNGLSFMETSASSGQNVEEAFEALSDIIYTNEGVYDAASGKLVPRKGVESYQKQLM